MFQSFQKHCKTSEHVILQSQVCQSIRNARILLSNATTFNYGNVILMQYSLSSVHHKQCGTWQSRFTPRIPNSYWAESSARGGVSLKLCVPVGVVSGAVGVAQACRYSGCTRATLRNSLACVRGHCISHQLMGTIWAPAGRDFRPWWTINILG